jgi:hypothetical protein
MIGLKEGDVMIIDIRNNTIRFSRRQLSVASLEKRVSRWRDRKVHMYKVSSYIGSVVDLVAHASGLEPIPNKDRNPHNPHLIYFELKTPEA